ncbi:MAG: VOC family protein [Stackebrandtia sp.]
MTTPIFNFMGFVAADMAASLAFYRELGLEIPDGAEKEDHVQVTLDNGVTLAWDKLELIKSIVPDWTQPSGSPRIGLAFQCESPADVDRVYAAMTAADGSYAGTSPWDAFWSQRYASLTDPDGNSVDLYAWLPGAQPD